MKKICKGIFGIGLFLGLSSIPIYADEQSVEDAIIENSNQEQQTDAEIYTKNVDKVDYENEINNEAQETSLNDESAIQSEIESKNTKTFELKSDVAELSNDNLESQNENEEIVITEPINGFFTENGKTYYYVNDIKQKGQAKINGYWYNFDDNTGAMKTGFVTISKQSKTVYYDSKGRMLYGFQTINGNWYYFNKDSGAMKYTGVAQNPKDKKWYFVRNGKGEKFTGISKSIANSKWYFTKSGILDWGYSGTAQSVSNNKYYAIQKGALNWSFTGVAKSNTDNKWHFVRKGAQGEAFTGWSKSIENGKWYFTRKGVLDWNFTGVAKSVENGKWYHGKKGVLDWKFTGVSKSVSNGKWYSVQKGKLNWKSDGLYKSVANGKYYYCKNGELNWNYIGRAWNIDQKRYSYVSKGRQIENRTLDRAAELLFVANGRKNTGWNLYNGYIWTIKNISLPTYLSIDFNSIPQDTNLGSAYYFDYGFDYRVGNCLVFNALIYEMGKVLNLNIKQVGGNIHTANNPQGVFHSWCEITENGKTTIIDADMEKEKGVNAWKISYNPWVKGKQFHYKTQLVLPQ